MMHLKYPIHDNWQFRIVDDESWRDAQVPGSVFQDLRQAGLMEDPYYRDNEQHVEAWAVRDYEYRTTFDADEAWLKSDAIELVCEGLNTLAMIELNGIMLAETDNMHRSYKWDVRSYLRRENNELRIVFRSSLQYIREKQEQRPIWGQFHTLPGFPHLRKASYMFGWDWGPVIPDMGIWKEVYIQCFDAARIENVHVRQQHAAGKVSLTADVRVQPLRETVASAALEWQLTAPDGQVISTRGALTADGEVRLHLEVDHPQLWWPNGYGEQALYTCELRLLVDGVHRDRWTREIGLREIKLNTQQDQWGESFEFVVNGNALFMKGANYIPEDNFTGKYTAERTERLIRDCVAANFNMIRVWGGGLYPADEFYELCDRYGLIVWQDFMFACANYSLAGGMGETIRQEALQQIRRLRHHASLGLWCGNNEIEMAWCEWGIPEDEALKRDHVRLFEELLPELVRRYDPDTDYWPSSPSSGGGFDDPTAENRGDAHYWDVWHGLKPFADYRKYHFRFVSEFGFQSFPSLKTVEAFTLPEDRNIFSHVMEQHQKNEAANGKILYYLSETFRYPKDFDSLLYASQLLQAEAIKYGVEHWRRNRGRCMGTLYWQLNDCWPVASWASVDYYGRWKALHYYAKRFYAPELASAAEEADGKIGLWLTNDRLETVEGTLCWQLRDAKGACCSEGEQQLQVDPLTATEGVKLDFSQFIEKDRHFVRNHFVSFQWKRGGQVISEGSVMLCPPKHFMLQAPQIHVEITDADESWQITLRAEGYAKRVELDFRDADIVLEDNYFDLYVNEPRTLSVLKRDVPHLSAAQVKDALKVRCLQDSYE